MATVFALLLQACGLSHREAATYLDARPDTVKAWASGRRTAPDGALAQLAALAEQIDEAADRALVEIGEHIEAAGAEPEAIELGLAADDAEAPTLDWPCVGAHRALLGLIVARGMAEGHRFAIVPRGSTVATAAAADARERQR